MSSTAYRLARFRACRRVSQQLLSLLPAPAWASRFELAALLCSVADQRQLGSLTGLLSDRCTTICTVHSPQGHVSLHSTLHTTTRLHRDAAPQARQRLVVPGCSHPHSPIVSESGES